MSDTVTVTLSRDEALVLHEWLARVVDEENGEGVAETLEDEAEIWALSALYAQLEQVMTEPYEPGFEKLLKAARKALLARTGRWDFDTI